MKKSIAVVLTFCLCLSVLLPSFAAEDAIAVTADWHILIAQEATQYETFAAEKLQAELSKVFKEEIEITEMAEGNYIAVGSVARTDVSAVAVNGYRIQVIDGNIHIAGTGERGLQAGTYRFLEEFCGRKVYTRTITVLPNAESVVVPADTDIVYEPYFEYTDTDWNSPRDVEYSMANGLNGGTYRRLPEEMGGTVNYLGGFCHTMGGLCETVAHKDSNPEQLALHDGERTVEQPCLTNPDVLAIATKNVLAILEEKYDPTASVQIVSVTQNDNYNYCECERCKAFESAHGDVQSATMINFVNQIADAVKDAGYENAVIDTFAYQYTRQAPTGIIPRENVIVRLCTIECCFCHTLDDPSCERNSELMKDLADWNRICNRIYVWDYTTNYSNTCIVFPDFDVIQRNMQVFYEHGVKGVYEEGNYYIDNCDTEFGELRAYMIAKSMQDPYCDMDAEIDGFLAAYYGPGGELIEGIIQKHLEYIGEKPGGHIGIGEGPNESFRFSDREIALIDDMWNKAKEAAETAEQLEHIARSELSWRFWKASTNKGEYSLLNPCRYEEKQKLFDDLKEFGVNMLNEGGYGDYLDCYCIRYVPANEWNMYEADEPAPHFRLFFGRILELFTPLLAAFGMYYGIARLLNGYYS